MRQTVCARTFAAGACMASVIVGPAAAQTIEYRTTDLGNMRFIPDPDEMGTFGINNKGQVAFGLIPAGQSEIQAAIWLPVPDYGLLAGVVILLSPPVGHSLPSILRDVNIDGQFVGQVSGVSLNEGEAIVYDLGAGVTTLLGVLQPNGTWSRAIAITDGPDAIPTASTSARTSARRDRTRRLSSGCDRSIRRWTAARQCSTPFPRWAAIRAAWCAT